MHPPLLALLKSSKLHTAANRYIGGGKPVNGKVIAARPYKRNNSASLSLTHTPKGMQITERSLFGILIRSPPRPRFKSSPFPTFGTETSSERICNLFQLQHVFYIKRGFFFSFCSFKISSAHSCYFGGWLLKPTPICFPRIEHPQQQFVYMHRAMF